MLMCHELRDLDIQSRAAESIVEDWQGPIVCEDAANSDIAATRAIWTINELVALLLRAVELFHNVLADQ